MGRVESNTCAGEGASVEGLPSSACWRGPGPRWPAAGCGGPRSVVSPPHSDAPRWHWGGPSDTWCGSEFDWRTSPNTPAACPHLEPTSLHAPGPLHGQHAWVNCFVWQCGKKTLQRSHETGGTESGRIRPLFWHSPMMISGLIFLFY